MKKVYFISGLGADKRVFSFLDLSFCEPVFIEWITPLKNESLESYARRLLDTIPEKHPVVVGVSFGGMLATEMAKADPELKAVIIASNKSAKEFPGYLRASKYFPVYRWLPNNMLKKSAYAFKWVLGKNEKAQKRIILDIIRETDMGFVKWAVNAILYWNNTEIPENITHIHGTGDKLLPYKFVKADYTIPNGRHVLPLDHPIEISQILKSVIT